MIITTAILLGIAVPVVATQLQKDKHATSADTINVVERTIKSIDFHQRTDATRIDFYGAILLPASSGEAKVENRRTFTEIKSNSEPAIPTRRPGILTYVLWAITPEIKAPTLMK
jgi:hypothetical protein